MWRVIESRLRGTEGYEDIFQLEAIGPLLALQTWPDLLRDCLWIHYIDNTGSQSALINGSSSILSGDYIAGATWDLVAKRRVFPWFDRVESEANPVDQLSRGVLQGPWRLVKLRFPEHLRCECTRHLERLGA